jgi:hypothetical protein
MKTIIQIVKRLIDVTVYIFSGKHYISQHSKRVYKIITIIQNEKRDFRYLEQQFGEMIVNKV